MRNTGFLIYFLDKRFFCKMVIHISICALVRCGACAHTHTHRNTQIAIFPEIMKFLQQASHYRESGLHVRLTQFDQLFNYPRD